MNQVRPIHIVLVISLVAAGMAALCLAILSGQVDEMPGSAWWFPLLIFLVIFLSSFLLVKYFISDRLRGIHRTIRREKLSASHETEWAMTEDVFGELVEETKDWAEVQRKEIARLKEQEEFRREFIGNLAHELKTPIFSIQGYILTLLEGGLEDPNVNRQFLERASNGVDRMAHILEDLDQIAKAEMGEMKLRRTDFDLVRLAKEVFEDLEYRADEKKVTLRFLKDYDPIEVNADRGRISQVLTNLVANSIAYGQNGGETVIRFFRESDHVRVEVADNGIGIAEKDMPRLFERFFRVDRSRSRHQGGSGLGLAIVRHILEAHEEAISVRSTEGLGSTFSFTLPTT